MKETGSSGWKHALALTCMGIALAGLVGCAAEPVKKTETAGLVWPMPPEQPRIRFLAEYRSEGDLGPKNDLRATLLGEKKTGIALDKPYGVTASADGKRIYVTDTRLRAIMVFDLDRREVRPLRTDAHGALYNPLEIRLDRRGRLYVSDSERNEVLVLSPEGKTLQALGKPESIGRPTGLALDETRNRLYVTDTIRHRVLVYDMDGKFLFDFGERGADPGQFNYPVNLAVDREGRILVTDTGNFRVQVFDQEGKYLNTFGRLGDSYGSFSRPKGVAVDADNNIYVIDAAFNNFQIFDRDGKLLLFVGRAGREPGTFWIPTAIFIDSSDRVYVVDSMNARVQVFQYIKDKKGADQ
jgi:DNA-binding beta-propeller fold protein YncE